MPRCPHGRNRHTYTLWFHCHGCNKEIEKTGTIKCLWNEDGKVSRKVTCRNCEYLYYGWSTLPCHPGESIRFEDAYVKYRVRNVDDEYQL